MDKLCREIGHSLGAHVAGNAGAFSKSGRLGRVTGLDPALPGVHMLTTEDNRLDPNDATFVDVVHSCGGILGFLQPLGHVDFYPNAGTAVQPGCCCVTEITGHSNEIPRSCIKVIYFKYTTTRSLQKIYSCT